MGLLLRPGGLNAALAQNLRRRVLLLELPQAVLGLRDLRALLWTEALHQPLLVVDGDHIRRRIDGQAGELVVSIGTLFHLVSGAHLARRRLSY